MSPAGRLRGLVGGQGGMSTMLDLLDVLILVGLSPRRHCEG